MKTVKKCLSCLLCAILLLGLTACGDPENNTPQNASSENTIQSTVTSMPEKSDPLEEVAGLWAHVTSTITSPVRITEDGKWGYQHWVQEMTPSAEVMYSDGALYVKNNIRIWLYTPQDGKFVGDNGSELVRYSKLYTAATAAPSDMVGTWQFEDAAVTMVINADATWYHLNAKGEKMHEGFIATSDSDKDDDYVEFVSDTMPPFMLTAQNSGKLLCYTFGDYGNLNRVS